MAGSDKFTNPENTADDLVGLVDLKVSPTSMRKTAETDDLYRDFLQDLEYFDTSEYPRENFLHSERNKKVLEK
ncbi:unnamed protein product, partial [Porites evermanni]